jgi:hypothetical protein
MIKTSLIIGYGNIGEAIGLMELQVLHPNDIKIIDSNHAVLKKSPKQKIYDVIHICYPCVDPIEYIKETQKYLEEFNAPIILIHSTVPPFILEKLFISPDSVVLHCPIRGTHPDIIGGIKKYPLIIGSVFPIEVVELERIRLSYFTAIWNVEVIFVSNSNESALGKLMNTAWYSMQIAFANQIQRICDDFGLDFKNVYNTWMETDEINSKYEYNSEKDRAIAVGTQIPRPIMVAGELGGHCLMPNIKLAESLFANNFTQWIMEMNQYGKELTIAKQVFELNIHELPMEQVISELDDIFKKPTVLKLRNEQNLISMKEMFSKIPNGEQKCKDMYGLTPDELDGMKLTSMQKELWENEEK